MPPATPAPVLRDTVAVRVAEQLRMEIRDGALVAGAPLRQNEVAARLGVSSTPVREAFQILERQGLVQREDRRGVRVFHPSAQDLLECYEVRAALEGRAVRCAAVALAAGDLDRLAELLARMADPALPRERFLLLHEDFHSTIAAAAGNQRLLELIAAEQAASQTYVAFLGVEPASREDAGAEHLAVLDALRLRDPDAAEAAMGEHLVRRARQLQARLAAQKPG